MAIFKTVLLTIDVTEPASWEKALPTAIAAAQDGGGAALHVVAVVPDYGMPLVAGFFPAEFREKALRVAGDALDKILADGVPPELRVERHIRYGAVHEEILAAATAVGADLLIMASHAPDRLREFTVGSKADRVVRRSPVSVLVVR